MDYGEVLVRSWRIVWKHKVLWIFGILAGCARGGGRGGGGGGGGGGGSGGSGNQPFGQLPSSEFQQFLTTAGDWIGSHLWVVVLLVLIALVLVVLSIFLGTIGRIGLIRGASKADGGEETLAFGELFSGSMPFFWRVFALSLLFGLAAFIVVLITVVPLLVVTTVTFGLALLCLLPFLCIFMIVFIAAGLVIQLADAAMVLENLGLAAGVRRGWEVLKTNIGPVLIIWLIAAVIGFVVGLVLALPILIIVIPAAIAFAVSGQQSITTPLIIAGLCVVAYLPFLLVLNGILTAYLESVWTLTYLRLTRPKEAEAVPAALPANA